MDHKNALSITVTGLVQGVWYRVSTHEKAIELKLNGFVQNQKDGSVYIEAEGDDNQLLHLVQWCKIGPEMAKVDTVIVNKIAFHGFDGFKIKRKQQ